MIRIKMKIKYFFNFLISFSILTSCSNPAVINNSAKPVTFNAPIDKKILSNKRDLEARLYNEEQQKILDATANCTVSFDTVTKKETVNCPAGVVYKKAEPETFTFKVDEIKDSITMESKTVKVGQKYLLTMSGLSSDNCNTASARIEDTATSDHVNITNLQWMQTELGCLTAPVSQ
jgi:hypothetical protein